MATMLARCSSAALWGLDAVEVTVEVDLAPGLPGLQLVGLPDAAVQEARERVRGALRNSGLRVPLSRVVVSLAPADLRKAGPGFDLPIALGLLIASGQLDPAQLEGFWSVAELGLDGHLRPVRGMLALALAAQRGGAKALLVPSANGAEAALVEGLEVWAAADLSEALGWLRDPAAAAAQRAKPRQHAQAAAPAGAPPRQESPGDLCEVRGQPHGRRALELAAAGGHHLLLVGPPGSGKTMLARRLPGLLPPLARPEALELTRLQSVAGLLPNGSGLVAQRPFRSPHHSCSAAALIGGGPLPRPGELSLAHHGVLFLDELAEFRREVLDQLRQPLEQRQVWISRARQRCCFPCRIILVAACNPCPCGWTGDPQRSCVCGEGRRRRYWARLSGPLLDRIDLQVAVRRAEARELAQLYRPAVGAGAATAGAGALTAEAGDAGALHISPNPPQASTAEVAARVLQARERMGRRNPDGRINADLPTGQLALVLELEDGALALWERALAGRRLTARGGERLLRVARTICDLEGRRRVNAAAVAEAIAFRSFDLVAEPMEAGAAGPERDGSRALGHSEASSAQPAR
jgi:magnesium chelatase family protein